MLFYIKPSIFLYSKLSVGWWWKNTGFKKLKVSLKVDFVFITWTLVRLLKPQIPRNITQYIKSCSFRSTALELSEPFLNWFPHEYQGTKSEDQKKKKESCIRQMNRLTVGFFILFFKWITIIKIDVTSLSMKFSCHLCSVIAMSVASLGATLLSLAPLNHEHITAKHI